ncbi:MAG: ribonuclease III [Gammaproteobacteria bacterium]|nr:ribonuclease III [Gammaproteobacteria bacterium]
MSTDLSVLCGRLHHRFRDAQLLSRALTHRSCGARNNERLEFLGDAVISLVMADALYARFPSLTEGELTRLRARLVRAETLAAVARELDLGPLMRLGPGELKSGGYDRDSILSDALEAVLGALYLDGGYEAARGTILLLFAPRLDGIEAHAQAKDPKTRLQEFLQGRGLALPEYGLLEVRGEDHEQMFVVGCRVSGLPDVVRGEGSTRRHAEQQAALTALQRLMA